MRSFPKEEIRALDRASIFFFLPHVNAECRECPDSQQPDSQQRSCLEESIRLVNFYPTYICTSQPRVSSMKLDAKALRYLTAEDFRVLTAVRTINLAPIESSVQDS